MQQAREEAETYSTLKDKRYKEIIKKHNQELAAYEKAVADKTKELEEKVAKAEKQVLEVQQERDKVTSGIESGLQAADTANKTACGVKTSDQWIVTQADVTPENIRS